MKYLTCPTCNKAPTLTLGFAEWACRDVSCCGVRVTGENPTTVQRRWNRHARATALYEAYMLRRRMEKPLKTKPVNWAALRDAINEAPAPEVV